jgi:hypothetical protein
LLRAALWLASDDAGFVNGHALVVDGGLTGGREWEEKTESSPLIAAIIQAYTHTSEIESRRQKVLKG